MKFRQLAVSTLGVLSGLALIVLGLSRLWRFFAGKSVMQWAIPVGLVVLLFIPLWLLLSPILVPAFRQGFAELQKRLGIVSDE